MDDYTDLVKRLRGYPEIDECDEAADAIEAQAARIAELERKETDALREATILAESLHKKHWPEITGWQVLDEAAGVITQINNMCAGLDERIIELKAALKPFAKAAANFDDMPIKNANEWFAYSGQSSSKENGKGAITVGDLRAARAALGEMK